VFPNMHEFLTTNELQLKDRVKGDIKQHLTELGRQLPEYFPSMGNANSWVRYLFTNFQQKQLAEFWVKMRAEFPELSERTVKILVPFATTYLCE
ncbi:ZBED5 protein, partial [Polyodon spathula]|nr:ZBED5 protein [Polyodon spathula]